MTYRWEWQDLELRYFHPREFDHPAQMNRDFLLRLDELRHRCGFAIVILDDARTKAEHDRLYRAEIARGESPPDSSHLRGCAVDCRPATPSERSEIQLVNVATGMYLEGEWPGLGLLIETRHFHLDSDPHLIQTNRRPYIAPGVSR